MSVIVRGMEMPKECGECRWFHFHGETCTTPKYYLDARCELVKSGQDWYGKDSKGGWIGKSISHLPGYGDYYTDEHCVEIGSRASDCPLVELPEKHGKLIDGDELIEYCKQYANMYKDSSLNTDKARRDELHAVIGEIINMETVIEAEGSER